MQSIKERVNQFTSRLETPIAEQYASYLSFHLDPTNQLVHIFGVPVINWTFLVLMSYVSRGIFLNLAFAVCIAWTVYYSTLNADLGVASVLVFTPAWLSSYAFMYFLPHLAWVISILLNMAAWAAQIYSHRVFEGNNPAVFSHPVSALVMAPAFVIIEVAQKFDLLNSIDNFYTPGHNGFQTL